MRTPQALIVALLLLGLALPHVAFAQDDNLLPEPESPGWFLPLGVNLGVGLDEGDVGFLLGGELSAVYLESTTWFGFYGDTLYDFGSSSIRSSVGIEGGWFVVGVEAGYVLQIDDAGNVLHGLRLSGLLTSGLISGYLRWERMIRDESQLDRPNIFELGVLLKWPIRL